MRISYDQVPYPILSHALSHPDHLATLATLLGLAPPPVAHCRVLELGCAGGGNLIPMAYGLPESEWVGIDNSQRQIDNGQAAAAALGLRNITLKCMDILGFPPDLGQFDYIIAHGVYSWVGPEVRDKVLQICKEHLAPNGVAYVSYNTYPGWHMMSIIRDAMLYRTRTVTDPYERAAQGRAMLELMAKFSTTQSRAYGHLLDVYADFLQGELKGSSAKGDAYLLRDELSHVNAPVYFHQFVEHAARWGLQYLVEAKFSTVFPDNFSLEMNQALHEVAENAIELEQYRDFLQNRTFRQTLLCHDSVHIPETIAPERISDLYVTSQAHPVADQPDDHAGSVEQFRSPDGAILSIDHPVSRAAMRKLAETWPQAISFTDLLSAARSQLGKARDPGDDSVDLAQDGFMLGVNLLRAYGYSKQLVGLHVHAPAIVSEVSELPMASPIARIQAHEGTTVTSLWHTRVHLSPLQCHLLRDLDGTRDRTAFVDGMIALVAEGVLTVQQEGQPVEDIDAARDILEQELEEYLHSLVRAALLIS